ncbi:MAG: thiamine phosphate synthase [Acidobacteria bacterium]|nr:thiamine phosphate synthase [Acidobacteriota bacterium]MCB9397440.1 thiamine phosphate synthase [Acidobacteriota bacterium]
MIRIVSGWDPSGLAGMAADLRVAHGLDVQAESIISCITDQNAQRNNGIRNLDMPIAEHLRLLDEILPGRILKTGLLPRSQDWQAIADWVEKSGATWICDPVFSSSLGGTLWPTSTRESLLPLFPAMGLFTPNLDEASQLLGRTLPNDAACIEAAQTFLQWGCRAVLLKGGHRKGRARDLYMDANCTYWLDSPRLQGSFRATGCMLATAIACALSWDWPMLEAVVFAKTCLNQQLHEASQNRSQALGLASQPDIKGCIPDLLDLNQSPSEPFPGCPKGLGFYPIVDSADWIKRLAALGLETVQLRVKNLPEPQLRAEIRRAVALSRQFNLQLFINDYWQIAIEEGAFGVHLGQEDLQNADMTQIREAGLRLGLSTHCFWEVARAKSYHPTYLAIGPIYETQLKKMAFGPQGLSKLRQWRQLLSGPLVAIGGISLERAPDVLACGVGCIAVVSAITAQSDPESAFQNWQRLF